MRWPSDVRLPEMQGAYMTQALAWLIDRLDTPIASTRGR